MNTRIEIRIGGTGGQGLILAAKMLADALAAGGKRVAQSQTYEPTSRGGFCNADLVVSDAEVDFPLTTALDQSGAARPAGRQAVLAAAQARRAGHRRHAAVPRTAGGQLPPLSPAAQPHRPGNWAASG